MQGLCRREALLQRWAPSYRIRWQPREPRPAKIHHGAMLIGMVLGIRFRIIVLVPAILVGWAILRDRGAFKGETAWRALLAIMTSA
jgi:hypothetical protein